MTINIENEYTANAKDLSDEMIREIAERVINEALSHEGCPYEAEIDLLITGDEEIRELNNSYRGLDKSTDVLSFPLIDYIKPADFDGFDERNDLFNPDSGELMLGDIVISMDHCLKQAEDYGHNTVRELAFLVAHSMLHLLGYDHETEAEASDMEQRQEEILIKLGYIR